MTFSVAPGEPAVTWAGTDDRSSVVDLVATITDVVAVGVPELATGGETVVSAPRDAIGAATLDAGCAASVATLTGVDGLVVLGVADSAAEVAVEVLVAGVFAVFASAPDDGGVLAT